MGHYLKIKVKLPHPFDIARITRNPTEEGTKNNTDENSGDLDIPIACPMSLTHVE